MAYSMIEISVRTPEREVLVDITERVQTALSQAAPGFSGLVNVFVPHTTAGVTINEGADPSVIRDIVDSLRRLVPRDAGYRHAEGNSDAHIKASLMGSSVSGAGASRAGCGWAPGRASTWPSSTVRATGGSG